VRPSFASNSSPNLFPSYVSRNEALWNGELPLVVNVFLDFAKSAINLRILIRARDARTHARTHARTQEEPLRGNAEIIANEACPVQRSDSRGRMQRYAPLHDHAHWTGRGGTIAWLRDRSLRVRARFHVTRCHDIRCHVQSRNQSRSATEAKINPRVCLINPCQTKSNQRRCR